ncbi:hypothetical protein JVT61DRAFT_2092 [Boletus reticuloceps]|uniref:Uncharacterized protein n=1 Tax=Boletus reticuloceps TaxID=495285 RepID=A0A8I2YPQ1_9AGAM|nr:hypothetical protein JVT61DRAFT_2092 [Boletus reticuloceps]
MDHRPGTPPPVHHVLRPHHIDLIAIFLLVFKEFRDNLPPNFLLCIYRFLLFEVSEVGASSARLHTHLIRSGCTTENPPRDSLDTTIRTRHRVPQCPEPPYGFRRSGKTKLSSAPSYLIKSPQAKPTHERRPVDQLFPQFVAYTDQATPMI